MNEILVAVDFNDTSINAYNHAVGLAEKMNASLLLAWVGNKVGIKNVNAKNFNDAKTIAEKKFQQLIEEDKNKIDIEYKLLKGNMHSAISKLSIEMKVDMIILGIKGKSGVSRFFMGDNTSEIIKKSECPVITISDKRKSSQGLEKIVMPIDDSINTRQKVPIVTKIAKAFGAKVYILGVYTSNVASLKMRVDNYLKQVAKHFKTKKIDYEVKTVKSASMIKPTLNYSEEIEANLLAVMHNEEGSTSELFLGTQAQQLINQSHIPVVVVKNKDFIQERPGR